MSAENSNNAGLVTSQSSALSRSGTTSLIRRGRQDLIAKDEAEQWCKQGRALLHQEQYRQAVECFQHGLQLDPNHAELQFLLGDAYYRERDYIMAAFWCRKAAEQGHRDAAEKLAGCYKSGRGVSQDDELAAHWYRKVAEQYRRTAEQGDADAQWMLAAMYVEGQGVPRDPEQAISWFRKSGDHGDIGAQILLGGLYEAGETDVNCCPLLVLKDYAQAAYWYLKAAVAIDDYGSAELAQSRLGHMYENGLGVPKDLDQAVHWYRKAAEHGNEAAKAAFSRIEQQMTRESSSK